MITGSNSIDNSLQVKANNRNYQSSGVQLLMDHRISRGGLDHAMEAGLRIHNDYMDRYQWTDGFAMKDGQMQLTVLRHSRHRKQPSGQRECRGRSFGLYPHPQRTFRSVRGYASST